MKPVIVGTYEFGYEKCQLVLRESDGGEFWVLPGDIDCPRIKIGAEQKVWGDLVAVLCHEAMELSFERVGLRYSPSQELVRDHAAYLFVATHTQFAEAIDRAADFLARCLPDLSKAWKKWKQKKGSKKGH